MNYIIIKNCDKTLIILEGEKRKRGKKNEKGEEKRLMVKEKLINKTEK